MEDPQGSGVCSGVCGSHRGVQRKGRKVDARRLSRNESEKARRDRLNMHIQELARLVPMVAVARKKLDKSSVLRLTVNYLRLHYVLKRRLWKGRRWKQDVLKGIDLNTQLLERMDCFLMVVNRNGVLVYVSDGISKILGHSQVDVMGSSVYNIIHKEDHEILRRQLQPDDKDLQKANGAHLYTNSKRKDNHLPLQCEKSMYIRMKDVGLDQKKNGYQCMNFTGQLQAVDLDVKENKNNTDKPENGRSLCLVAMVKPVVQERVMEIVPQDTLQNSWVSQHSMSGQFIFCDQRLATLTGYLPQEQLGHYPYDYIIPEDLKWVASSHQRIFFQKSIPWTIFRMFTRNMNIIYCRASSNLVADLWTREPKYITSVNEVLPNEEGKHLLEVQEKVFAEYLAELGFEEGHKNEEIPETYHHGIQCSTTREVPVPTDIEVKEKNVTISLDDLCFKIHLSPESAQSDIGRLNAEIQSRMKSTVLNGHVDSTVPTLGSVIGGTQSIELLTQTHKNGFHSEYKLSEPSCDSMLPPMKVKCGQLNKWQNGQTDHTPNGLVNHTSLLWHSEAEPAKQELLANNGWSSLLQPAYRSQDVLQDTAVDSTGCVSGCLNGSGSLSSPNSSDTGSVFSSQGVYSQQEAMDLDSSDLSQHLADTQQSFMQSLEDMEQVQNHCESTGSSPLGALYKVHLTESCQDIPTKYHLSPPLRGNMAVHGSNQTSAY